MSLDLTKENPYVAVAAKKHRNLKKKMEKIVKIEGQQQAGKALDQEQLALLNSKKSVEKALLDVAALKSQLEDVAKQQFELGGKVVFTGESNEAAGGEKDDQFPETPVADHTANVETNTDEIINAASSTMTDHDLALGEEGNKRSTGRSIELEEKVTKLLKALHVYQRYKEVMNHRNLPDTVDFFGKTLLGFTTISGFQDTLNHSSRVAGYYLNDDLAQNEVVRGCSYAHLSSIIDSLADEMEKAPNRGIGVPGSSNSLTALLRTTISSTPAIHPGEVTIDLPPTPHVPHRPESAILPELTPTISSVPPAHITAPAAMAPPPAIVSSVPSSKFDLPSQPQALPPSFVITPNHEPSFSTSSRAATDRRHHGLQFGEGFNTASAAIVAPPALNTPTEKTSNYTSTINFQPHTEAFFQLTPPSQQEQQLHHIPQEGHHQMHHQSIQEDITHPEVVPAEEVTPKQEEESLLLATGSGDNEGAAEGGANRNRNRRSRNFKREGFKRDGSGDDLATANEGGDRPNRRERFQKNKKFDNNNKEGSVEGKEGEEQVKEGGEGGKSLPKKRSFNKSPREHNKQEGGEQTTGDKEAKDFNWTKKFSKDNKDNKLENKPEQHYNKENRRTSPRKDHHSSNKTESTNKITAVDSTPAEKAPVTTETPKPHLGEQVHEIPAAASSAPAVKPAEPTTAPTAAVPPVKKSWGDALRAGLSSTVESPKESSSTEKGHHQQQKQSSFNRNNKPHRDSSAGKNKETSVEDATTAGENSANSNKPRRDRSNNRIPREGREVDAAEGSANKKDNESPQQEHHLERPFHQRGSGDGDRRENREHRPARSENYNRENRENKDSNYKPRPTSNNRNNNNNASNSNNNRPSRPPPTHANKVDV